jgi:pimeloyl-ACP methyl ester carboxylesterase
MGPVLHYIRSGTGEKIMLTFHGYGQDNNVFTNYKGYTFYHIDLFFHGKSAWNNGEEPLKKVEWRSIIEQVLVQNNIQSFSLLGFSMGGRFALATLEAFPHRVKEIILVAPDGIKTNTWYTLATYPIVLRRFFKSMINNYSRFLRIARAAKRLGLIDKSVLRFVETQMDSEEKRKRVYYSWVVFRHLKFDIDSIKKIIRKNGIDLRVVVGRYDKIIKAKDMKRLTSKVEILDAGHNDIIRKIGANLDGGPAISE